MNAVTRLENPFNKGSLKMSLCRRLSVVSLVFAFALTLVAQSNSPLEGKWVFNAEKSIFSPGPLPKSETLSFANGKLTVEGVSAQGQPFLWSFTPVPGQKVLVTGRDNLTVETKESGNTIVHMWSDQSGTSYGEGQISPDGQSMRYVLIGTRWGNHVYEVSVFDKVDNQ
jgi:hypothetical protein